jgi:hypothetical protein
MIVLGPESLPSELPFTSIRYWSDIDGQAVGVHESSRNTSQYS